MVSHYPTPKYIKFSHYPDIFTRDFSHYPQISAQLATSMHHQLHLMSIRHFNKPLTINKLLKTILRLGTS